MKGRKPIPDAVKKMKGTDQPSRLREKHMPDLPFVVKLPPPKNLGKMGKKIYKTVGNMLINYKVLNALNFTQFYHYCKETELYFTCMEKMPDVEDMVHQIKLGKGNVTSQVKALRKIAESALQNSNKLASEFGLTPGAQSKILSRLNSKPKNEIDSFLNS